MSLESGNESAGISSKTFKVRVDLLFFKALSTQEIQALLPVNKGPI